jgi:hypothetical protein
MRIILMFVRAVEFGPFGEESARARKISYATCNGLTGGSRFGLI